MDPAVFNSLIDISGSPAARLGQADLMLERARWAATVFDRYDREATMRIVDAVAQAAHDHAGEFAKKLWRKAALASPRIKRLKIS